MKIFSRGIIIPGSHSPKFQASGIYCATITMSMECKTAKENWWRKGKIISLGSTDPLLPILQCYSTDFHHVYIRTELCTTRQDSLKYCYIYSLNDALQIWVHQRGEKKHPHLCLSRGRRKRVQRPFGIIIRWTFRTQELIQLLCFFDRHAHTRRMKPSIRKMMHQKHILKRDVREAVHIVSRVNTTRACATIFGQE